ncbi:Mariner Mos1 transposase [Eumeta japonica]|uniref:Mariner Mos1 transposase n=1 Tax=Eumeta variegata TaxID=151549 RepID=A0A4C1U7H8_EUMVA|nr:Mariner Mos1 transposase [Eumeta japonica]
MAHVLLEQRFTSYEDTKIWVDWWIVSKDKEFFRVGIRTLPERFNYCYFTINIITLTKNGGHLFVLLIEYKISDDEERSCILYPCMRIQASMTILAEENHRNTTTRVSRPVVGVATLRKLSLHVDSLPSDLPNKPSTLAFGVINVALQLTLFGSDIIPILDHSPVLNFGPGPALDSDPGPVFGSVLRLAFNSDSAIRPSSNLNKARAKYFYVQTDARPKNCSHFGAFVADVLQQPYVNMLHMQVQNPRCSSFLLTPRELRSPRRLRNMSEVWAHTVGSGEIAVTLNK